MIGWSLTLAPHQLQNLASLRLMRLHLEQNSILSSPEWTEGAPLSACRETY